MKLNTFTLTAAALALVLTGCVNPEGSPDRTVGVALAGCAIGATSGSLIGSTSGQAGEGALIGAAIGMITGGLVGHSMDQDEQARLRQQAPQTYERVDQGQPLGLSDMKALAQAKISDDIIISQISNSHTVYHLSAADIIDLRNFGVSDKVINYMINTQTGSSSGAVVAPQAVVAQPPPPVPVETVVVAPAPGYVWIGGEWIWSGRWVWVAGHWGYPPYPSAVWVGGSWGHESRGWRRNPGHWR